MKNRTILLVEDNPDDLELTLMALREGDIQNEIVTARDGKEALDWLFGEGVFAGRDVRHQPIVVLLDLKLPKINGLEVLETLRADPRTRTTPVVMLTSSREQEDLARAYASGVNSYIQKPVEFESFSSAVHSLGAYWSVLNQSPPPPASDGK